MDLGSLIIGLAIALIAFAFVARPLFMHEGIQVSSEDRQLSELQAERDRLLRSLQELEMDYAVGKITEGDYQEQRGQYLSKGAATLRAIDEIQGESLEKGIRQDVDAEIEAAVAELRKAEISEVVRYCPACGQSVKVGDLFCTNCGETLSVKVS